MAYKDKLNRNTQQKRAKSGGSGIDRQPASEMALGKLNFIYMGVAGAMIIVGFLLMLGPSSTVDNFNPDIFSTRRIVVGPLIAFLGFVAMAIAIIAPDKIKCFGSKHKDRE